jgi:DNA-binding transcriptional MocR family regulator
LLNKKGRQSVSGGLRFLSGLVARRGVTADSENVLVTVGAQQAPYLIATLLRGPGRVVAMEDPGYPDARNIFGQLFDEVRFIPVDDEGFRSLNANIGCGLRCPGHCRCGLAALAVKADADRLPN